MSDNAPKLLMAKASKSLKRSKKSLLNPGRNSLKSVKTAKKARSSLSNHLRKSKTKTKVRKERLNSLIRWVEAVFGEAAMAEIKARNLNVREVWELVEPTTQCHKVIGEEAIKGTTKCWICDETITDDKGMTSVCEHILPVAQAAVYLRLYGDTRDVKRSYTDRNMNARKLEYAYAHALCNSVKSDKTGLEYTQGIGFKVDIEEIRNILKSIFNNTTHQNSKPLKAVLLKRYSSYQRFERERLPVIVARYQGIIDFLTRPDLSGNPRASALDAALIMLAGASGLSDSNLMSKKFYKILSETGGAELEAAPTILEDQDFKNMSYMFSFYDAVQDAVIGKLRPITSHAPVKPSYREYFAARGIDPRAALTSLNPERFQSDIFGFLIKADPILHRITRDKDRIIGIVSDFICLKLLPSFLPSPFNANPPRAFIREIEDMMAILNGRLQIKLDGRTAIKVLNEEYEKFVQISAAETLLSLGDDGMRRFDALVEIADEAEKNED